LDDVKVEDIKQWEADFHKFLDAKHAELLQEIKKEKRLDEAVTDRLRNAIKEFKALR